MSTYARRVPLACWQLQGRDVLRNIAHLRAVVWTRPIARTSERTTDLFLFSDAPLHAAPVVYKFSQNTGGTSEMWAPGLLTPGIFAALCKVYVWLMDWQRTLSAKVHKLVRSRKTLRTANTVQSVCSYTSIVGISTFREWFRRIRVRPRGWRGAFSHSPDIGQRVLA